MSVCRSHPDKIAKNIRTLFTDADTDMDADTDTDDRNSPNVFQLVPFFSGYGCADTDTERSNSEVTIVIGLYMYFLTITFYRSVALIIVIDELYLLKIKRV